MKDKEFEFLIKHKKGAGEIELYAFGQGSTILTAAIFGICELKKEKLPKMTNKQFVEKVNNQLCKCLGVKEAKKCVKKKEGVKK